VPNARQIDKLCEISMLGDRVSDFQLFFDEISSPSLKLCYDYGHGNIDEHGIDILKTFSSRLGSIHAHDNDQMSDMHWPVADPRGTIDWASEFAYLKSIGFKGPFILESKPADEVMSLINIAETGLY
jgi:sugar phosphate isomerase/epimerase